MFSDKGYAEVNREERHYCALVAHALLLSSSAREAFTQHVSAECGLQLDPNALGIFVEVAALRDYWYDLGDPRRYDEETHARRLSVIQAILRREGLRESTVDDENVFWTTSNQRKLWSPGRWTETGLVNSGLQDRLRKYRWAFNSKPDLLVMSSGSFLLVEAKVESGEGREARTGYCQYEAQDLVKELLIELVPAFDGFSGFATSITPSREQGLLWNDVLDCVDTGEIDEFTRQCFAHLRERIVE